ncbi:methylated-DNA--[protein]-cysteine S-methyltransferase [Halobacillus sp. Marseille-P3879]|uniref:methylated-DNA--[protein]-cysteine S-methyltransferase n=1 Tax=Halobacillus sp. Marseille-P3879 TaxID=2045014 RepID=UPI000C7BCF42|nr:methylated-DNA--[protein]-cysteine S-methyltransferase [Halobacillus sp. Marseille-P3879]
MYYADYDSPIGRLRIVAGESGELVRICLTDELWEKFQNKHKEIRTEVNVVQPIIKQLEEYFHGERVRFSFPFNPEGTDFQKKVWKQVHAIPYGDTKSYSAIAAKIGSPKAVRAVGNANRLNPIPIVVPCHRVIGKNQSMTGYAGGLRMKEALLKLEGSLLNNSSPH